MVAQHKQVISIIFKSQFLLSSVYGDHLKCSPKESTLVFKVGDNLPVQWVNLIWKEGVGIGVGRDTDAFTHTWKAGRKPPSLGLSPVRYDKGAHLFVLVSSNEPLSSLYLCLCSLYDTVLFSMNYMSFITLRFIFKDIC